MQNVYSCLWFDSQAEEAAKLYTKVFGGEIGAITRYGNSSATQAGRPVGSTLTVDFKMANLRVLGLNGGPLFKFTPSFSFFVGCESVEEIDRYWSMLGEGGNVRMGLDKYPWAERYGWTTDRFGVEWQFILAPRSQKIAPAFLFVDQLFGRGQEAIDFYMSVFPNSKIEMMAKDSSEKSVMHASFTLNGNPFVLMEGQGKHGHTFNEAFSICVSCETQDEIDRYWAKLVEGGGSHGPCGWLKDRFGVSWQVNPTVIEKYARDPLKFEKAMSVVMKQSKLVIADIVKAAEQQ